MSLASSLERKYATLYTNSAQGCQRYSDNATDVMTSCGFNVEKDKTYTFGITYMDKTLRDTYLERQSGKDEHNRLKAQSEL